MNLCRKLRLRDLYGKMLWAIKYYFNCIGLRHVKLYVVGSLAKNEEACIENDYVKVSDLDLLAFADTTAYVKCLLLNCYEYVSKSLSHLLFKRNIETETSISFFLICYIGSAFVNSIP